ncbi:MAG: GHKL domain-containing protein [Bacteroidetes bacterium]|nr:GHKL domain-containing protein [Bacteroidota bacterium]MCB0843766.1 GHKL domain-containing protein [Bacteroidota bacterium]
MWPRIKQLFLHFLTGYQEQPLEIRKKAAYLLATSSIILVGLTFVFLIHLLYQASYIMIGGDLFCYLTLALVFPLIKRGKVIPAANILIGGLLISLVIQKLLGDLYTTQPLYYLRLYETLSILILFLLFWSLFALTQKQLVIYLFSALSILIGHFTILSARLYPETDIPIEVWRTFLTGIVILITSGVISNLILNLSRELVLITEEKSQVIQTQKESLEQTVSERTEALQKKNEELKQFAYTTSHDLKEPLRMISGFLGLIQLHLKKNYPEDPEIEEYLKYAIEGSKRMTDLINGLLTYSRINTHQSSLTKVDLNEVVSATMATLKFAIEESEATIHSQQLPTITADKNQMVQLFQNLLENALKYHKESIPPKIEINHKISPRKVTICIKDNGVGITPEFHERIFHIFYRLPVEKTKKGTGIGLTICKKIVERHNGKIWVESKPGEGSTFCFTLPK